MGGLGAWGVGGFRVLGVSGCRVWDSLKWRIIPLGGSVLMNSKVTVLIYNPIIAI